MQQRDIFIFVTRSYDAKPEPSPTQICDLMDNHNASLTQQYITQPLDASRSAIRPKPVFQCPQKASCPDSPMAECLSPAKITPPCTLSTTPNRPRKRWPRCRTPQRYGELAILPTPTKGILKEKSVFPLGSRSSSANSKKVKFNQQVFSQPSVDRPYLRYPLH